MSEKLRAALRRAQGAFERYEKLHLAKVPAQTAKAEENAALARACAAALAYDQPTWQLVWCDGYARDNVSERVVASGIVSRPEAEAMLGALRQRAALDESNWYKLEPDTYRPYRWEP